MADALKMFNKIRMQSEWNTAMLFDGQFGAEVSGVWKPAKVEDGACVLIGDPLTHKLYDGTYGGEHDPLTPGATAPLLKDLNANKITAFSTTATDGIVGFVDFVGVDGLPVQGNYWKIGDKIAGIEVPAEWHTRVRVPQVGDEFYLGFGNFSAAPTVGQYAAPTDGSTLLTPAATKAGSGLCVKVLDERTMIFGTVNGEANQKMYRVRVIQK